MRKTDSIRVITFDLDNTLWDVGQTIRRAETLLREWMQTNTPDALAVYASGAIEEIRADIVARHPNQRHDLSFLRTEVLRACMLESGLAESQAKRAAEAAFEVFFVGRNDVVFFDNALKVLDDLSQRYRLFALTNGNADIHRVGIGQYFEGAVSSADVGASKPDPAMFSAVLARAGVQAPEAVHVGDHLSDDILGANRAGMRSIWFNRDGAHDNNGDSQPSAEVQSLSALPDSIAGLS
ncbi:MAG: HAD family hydrolase [Gammaproteobacteria bacterium]|jgi:HAD superfamily hydrolase (TIGR01509 family)